MAARHCPGECLPDAILHHLTPAALHELLHAANKTGNVAAAVQISALIMYRTAVDWGVWPWAEIDDADFARQPPTGQQLNEPRKRRRKLPEVDDA